MIQFALEHRLWWCALFGLSVGLVLGSQAIPSLTASKYLLLVAVVIHRVLCSTLFLSLPLITNTALSDARRLIVPQQLLMLLLFPMLCFAERIHFETVGGLYLQVLEVTDANQFLYLVIMISKAVLEWRHTPLSIFGVSRVRQLGVQDTEMCRMDALRANPV